MHLDPDQQRAVEARGNVVVSAGAGSGKTRVLTERFVDLVLSEDARVSEILALTFTKKAATEMFERIHRALLERASTQSSLYEQLAAFDEAQISTIDSFCAAILRDGAAGLGLPAIFEVNESGSYRGSAVAATRFLAAHSEHPVLGRLVRRYGIEAITEDLLLPLLDRYMRLSQPIDFSALDERRSRWLDEQITTVENRIDAAVERACLPPPGEEYYAEFAAELHRTAGDYEAMERHFETINLRRGKQNEETSAYKDLLREIGRGKNNLLERRRALVETRVSEADARALHMLLAEWQTEVLAERRRSGAFGYQEIMELAVQALLAFPDLQLSYRRRFRYIMIDEFQDNNRAQRDLLFVLAGDPDRPDRSVPTADRLAPGKLFFVGDQKQSIYRFRGADVRVFKHLAEQMGERIPLSHNYRSEPKLIEFFNLFFSRVFEGASSDYEAEFEPLKDRGEPRDDLSAAVTIACAEPNPESGQWAENTFAEGDWIAGEIRRLVSNEGFRGDQIAILLRSSGKQQHYERMLRRRGIPYQAQILRSLFLEAPAADLYALLQLHYYPGDRAAYATVLRSPFVMASDEALWRAMKAPRHSPFSPVEGLSEQDLSRFAVGRDLLGILERRIDRKPLYLVLEELWERSGYRYAILSRPSDHGYLEHFEYLVTIARSYDDRPAIEFVEYLRREMGKSEKIDEIDAPRRPGAVQIMTIHKSKGLEFPVVFIADCDSRPGGDRGTIVSMHDDIGLTIRIPPAEPGESRPDVFSSRADEEEQAQDVAERKRLLYVAATRAETRLYFTAGLRSTKRSPGESMWEMISSNLGIGDGSSGPAAEFADHLRVVAIPPLPEASLRDPVEHSARRRRSEWETLPEEVAVVEAAQEEIETSPTAINEALLIARGWAPTDPGRTPGQEAPAGAEGAPTEPSRRRSAALTLGTLTHLLLELRLRDGLTRDGWLAVPLEAEPHLGGPLDEGAGGDERRILAEAWELSEAFMESSLRRELEGAELRFETPFLYRLEFDGVTRYASGQFDLVAITPETVHVVDFKTDRAVDASHYDGQMALYIAAAGALYRRPVSLSIFALREARAIATSPVLQEVLREIRGSREAQKYLGWHLSPAAPLM